MYMCVRIYIYIEREREREKNLCVYINIYDPRAGERRSTQWTCILHSEHTRAWGGHSARKVESSAPPNRFLSNPQHQTLDFCEIINTKL